MATSRPPVETDVRLFGPFEARQAGRPLHLGVRKSVALLAWLVLEGRSARSRLTALFWPDADEEAARRNLRRELFRMRAAGLGGALLADDDSAALRAVHADTQAFADALQAGRHDLADTLYRGPLLDGLVLPGCDAFQDWLDSRRAAFARQWRQALAQHAAALQQQGRLREALAAQHRLLADDPLQEGPVREAMALHAALGERTQALALYDRSALLLHAELGVSPLAETCQLAEQLRSGVVPPKAPPSTAVDAVGGIGALHAPLVGRSALLAHVERSPAPVQLVMGEAGLGKSRLLAALAAGRAGVVTLRCTPLARGTALQPLAEIVRQATLAPDLREPLAPLLSEPSRRGHRARPEQRVRFIAALAEALRRLAGPGGTVLADDLQWADAGTLEVLAQLAQRRQAGPEAWPAVIAAARPFDADAPVADFVAAGRRGGWLHPLDLLPLDEPAVLELVRSLSGSRGGERFAARLARATGGNPFYLLETLRDLFERNEITLDTQGRWHTRYDEHTSDYAELPVPVSVRAAVLERLARLGPAVHRLLETAAFTDGRFDLDDVAPASGLSEWEAVQSSEQALSAQLLEREAGRLRFTHELVRSALLAQTGHERARLIHRRLARSQMGRGDAPARVAGHLQAAGDSREAATWWLKAARQAASRLAFDDALRHAAAAADAGDEITRFDALQERALTHRLLGRFDDMAADIEAAAAVAGPARSDRRRQRLLRRLRSLMLSDIGDLAGSYAIDRALLAEGCTSRREEAELLRGTGFAALFVGQDAEAAELLARAVPLTRRYKPEHLSPTLALQATALWLLGDLAGAEATVLQALAAASPSDPLQRADALNYGSMIAESDDRRDEALRRVHEAQQIAQTAGNPPRVAAFLANEVSYRFHAGDVAGTRAVQQRLEALVGGRTSPLARYMVASTAARAAWLAGDQDLALARGGEALALATGVLGGVHQANMAALLARWAVQRGECEAALAHAATAEAAVPDARVLLAAELVRAQVELARGQAAACAARLRAALAAPQRSDQERVLHRDLAALTLGRALQALGDADGAAAAVAEVRFSPALKAEARALRDARTGGG